MVAAVGWNVGDLITGPESVMEDIGEVIGLVLPRRGDRLPGAGPQGVLGQGAARRAVQGRRHAGRRAWRSASSIGWGLLEMFPGSLERDERLPYAANRVVRVRRRRRRRLRRPPPARLRQRAARPVRRAGADGGGDRAVPVAARRERAHRRGRVGDPRTARAVRQERLARLLRHPPRQVGGVRPERARRDHLPRRGRRVPGQRRPDRRSAGLARRDRRLADAVPVLRVGARRDGRERGCRASLPGGRPQRPRTRRRGDPATRTGSSCPAPT